MNTNDLLREIIGRLWRYKLIVLLAGVAGAILFFLYTNLKRPVYTARATVFPLTNTPENALGNSTLSGILGLADAPKSFSNEATINIIELSLSRYVREAVAGERLAAFGNKTIAALLIADYNAHTGLFAKAISLPTDSTAAATEGAELLKNGIVAKMSKHGVLELYFSHPDRRLVSPISFVLIDKVSQFYIDLKIRKATADYNFTVKKIESLDAALNNVDRRAIRMQNTTLFAPDKLEYEIPKDKINADKQRYVRQRDISLNNQEEALWRLQKVTPIISVLDKPTEPFTVSKPSALLYTIGGFIAGVFLGAGFLLMRPLVQYTRSQLQQHVLKK